jgi:hypothetical protein
MPVDYADPDVLDRLSRRAQEWATYFEENLREDIDRNAIAMRRVREGLYEILLDELNGAIRISKEYNIEPLRGHIVQIFSQEGMITAPNGVVQINTHLAGSQADFDQGIQHAKEKFDFGNRMDAQSAAEFWKNFIYGPVREGQTIQSRNEKTSVRKLSQMQHYYYRTIEGRLEGWADLAPYWIWINDGNYHSKGAYPRHAKTNFVQKSRERCQTLFDTALEEVIQEEENIISRSLENFLNNPDQYGPGDILDSFYSQGQEYYIYVTPAAGLVGVTSRRPG